MNARTSKKSWLIPVVCSAVIIGLTALVIFGRAKDAPQDTWDPAGNNAQKIDNLQQPVFLIAGIVAVLVMLAVSWCIWRFRDHGQPIPKQSHGKPALEIGLTILPALILIGVAVPTVGTLMALSKTDDTECVVNVTGQQWWWEIDYPTQVAGDDGTGSCGGVDIPKPIVTSGQLVMPVGTNVLLRGTSRDVIHSFWVPRINGKRDMVPGRIHSLRLHADEPGIYAGQCAEFCGLSHANMRMEIVALSLEDFQTWVDQQVEPAASPEPGSQAERGQAVFLANCSRCHQVDGLTNSDGTPAIARPEDNVYSGAAPNLTHLMSRNTFAGATWDLITPECREQVWEASPEDFGSLYLEGVTDECFSAVDLAEWIRNAPEKKPMFTEDLAATNGLPRGMPALGLTEDQIADVIAYLQELK